LLSEVRPARLHLIDPWRFESDSEYRGAWYGGTVAKNQTEMDTIYEVVFVHRGPSAEVGMKFPDAYFDWVYIDGNHLYEYVKGDLEVFATKLKPGGVLAGDDYGARGWWKGGVSRAVDEFVAARGCKLWRLGRQFVLLDFPLNRETSRRGEGGSVRH
jgi:SAM-dependent methyltransferase